MDRWQHCGLLESRGDREDPPFPNPQVTLDEQGNMRGSFQSDHTSAAHRTDNRRPEWSRSEVLTRSKMVRERVSSSFEIGESHGIPPEAPAAEGQTYEMSVHRLLQALEHPGAGKFQGLDHTITPSLEARRSGKQNPPATKEELTVAGVVWVTQEGR